MTVPTGMDLTPQPRMPIRGLDSRRRRFESCSLETDVVNEERAELNGYVFHFAGGRVCAGARFIPLATAPAPAWSSVDAEVATRMPHVVEIGIRGTEIGSDHLLNHNRFACVYFASDSMWSCAAMPARQDETHLRAVMLNASKVLISWSSNDLQSGMDSQHTTEVYLQAFERAEHTLRPVSAALTVGTYQLFSEQGERQGEPVRLTWSFGWGFDVVTFVGTCVELRRQPPSRGNYQPTHRHRPLFRAVPDHISDEILEAADLLSGLGGHSSRTIPAPNLEGFWSFSEDGWHRAAHCPVD